MNQKNALLLLFIFYAALIGAQTDTFDLNSYKARYDRRPAMSLDGSAVFNGNYASRQTAVNNGQAAARLSWQELRNTDELTSFWLLSGNLRGAFNQISSSLAGSTRYNSGDLAFSSQWAKRHYRPDNRFWGWSGTFSADGDLSSRRENDRRFVTFINPAIFRGKGRIEYAEDALLASWILEELLEAGITDEYYGYDITELARTITDIIGNRTFDFRRRRIYELERLQSTLAELGHSQYESFELFAILNDNWAFANRNFLPHGNRLTYGAEGTAYHWWSRFNDSATNTFAYNGAAFLEYIRARVINNHSGEEWSLRAQGGYQEIMDKFDKGDWLEPRESLFAQLSASYSYRWFPSSRTALRWTNRASMSWGERESGATTTSGGLISFEEQASWTSFLELDYFVNFQWSFQVRASSNLLYRFEQDLLRLQPFLRFNTVYYFF